MAKTDVFMPHATPSCQNLFWGEVHQEAGGHRRENVDLILILARLAQQLS